MWRGGCIIKVRIIAVSASCLDSRYLQSVFLGDITAAYRKNADLESLLFDDFFNKGGYYS